MRGRAPLVVAIIALTSCSNGDDAAPQVGATSSSGSTSSSSSGASSPPKHIWTDCEGSDQAWIRRAILALDGRRPWGQVEVNAYEDAMTGIRAVDIAAAGSAEAYARTLGADLENARKLVAQTIMHEDAFRTRWSDFVMEALHVVRVESESQASCYGPPLPGAIDDGSLAAYVRDNDAATASAPPIPSFTMGQLLSSALELDDLSPVYRGHLFAMVSKPFAGANVDAAHLEMARRDNFGAVFEAAYIHRDLVCLSCHNSEFSVTSNPDPTLNHAWPVPGLFEVALYGASNGLHSPAEDAIKGTDDLRSRSMLRYTGVADSGGIAPYGWAGGYADAMSMFVPVCGVFNTDPPLDPLAIDTYFGSIQSTPADPTRGLKATVWDLERSLRVGVDRLAAHGLERLAGNQLANADEAFAYLVAENIVEKIWNEAMGRTLTIANYFPRVQVQRDILESLTDTFVASHFSLKAVLFEILAHPAFNLKSPDEGCGDAAYELPNVFDPWTTDETDAAMRPNSPADGVFAISARPLRRSLHAAMQWPLYPEFPDFLPDEAIQIAAGFFLKDAEPGFRGLDFEGRLTWESVYGACTNLGGSDWIQRIVARAATVPGATVGDGVIALKDRLVGEPSIEAVSEQPALEALVKTAMSETNLGALDPQLRSVCGVLVSSPQFMMGGIVPKDTRTIPKLTPPDITYDQTCNAVAARLKQLGAPYAATCSGATTIAKK